MTKDLALRLQADLMRDLPQGAFDVIRAMEFNGKHGVFWAVVVGIPPSETRVLDTVAGWKIQVGGKID